MIDNFVQLLKFYFVTKLSKIAGSNQKPKTNG